MRLEYHESSDHAYLYPTEIGAGGVDQTFTFSEEEPRPLGGVNLDIDVLGRLVGIEFEAAFQLLSPALLAQVEQI